MPDVEIRSYDVSSHGHRTRIERVGIGETWRVNDALMLDLPPAIDLSYDDAVDIANQLNMRRHKMEQAHAELERLRTDPWRVSVKA